MCAALLPPESILGRLATTVVPRCTWRPRGVRSKCVIHSRRAPARWPGWGGTPASDARREGHAAVAGPLEKTERGGGEFWLYYHV